MSDSPYANRIWKGPRIKHELDPPAVEVATTGPDPVPEPPQPPLKRSRSQSVHEENDRDGLHRDEKRLKIESVEEHDQNIVDIASLVQQAEASVMRELMSEPHPDPAPEFEDSGISQEILDVINGAHIKLDNLGNDNDDNHDMSQDILNAINQAQVKPDHDDDISRDILDAINEAADRESLNRQAENQAEEEKGSPDTLWSSPSYYTRRKHIIPALGSLVGSAR